MADSFVHLHNHTEYSMLDGAAKVSRRRVKHKPLSKAIVTEHNVTRQCKVVCFAAALQESLDA